MAKHQFARFFSLDSPKAIKARGYGWLNAINYMAPHTMGGAGNLCGNASPACILLCLGWFSGQAGMVKGGGARGRNDARRSRIAKSKAFMHDRKAFMSNMVHGLEAAIRAAVRLSLKLCARGNGSTDVPWEAIKCERNNVEYPSVMMAFPEVQFVDYTKSLKRALRFAAGLMPANYHLTFSRSEINEADCLTVLAAGGNVAVVFGGAKPATWNGYRVIDGDKHDLRHLDPRGVVVGLSPKGHRAKRDKTGFVVR